jgi:hypothetical protein
MTGRAETPEQKRAIVERLLAAWLAKPTLRLGQMIDNAGFRAATALFYVEDEALRRVTASRGCGRRVTPSATSLARVSPLRGIGTGGASVPSTREKCDRRTTPHRCPL